MKIFLKLWQKGLNPSMTKQQVINKVEDLEEDNKALWHNVKCFEEDINKLKQEISKLYEDMRQMQKTGTDNT